jgi:rare lipoprotein A (peptidoglycan hydrolase)
LRIKDRYKNYKVCVESTGKCVVCYHNDYGPAEYTNKVIDLSSYAFKQLGIPLSR